MPRAVNLIALATVLAVAMCGTLPAAPAVVSQAIPSDFPVFRVPGHEALTDPVRALYWLHYGGSGPKATLWDEWLAGPGLWPAVNTGGQAQAMRDRWSSALSGRTIGPDGYVSTHQHPSIAHPEGWPFPMWSIGGEGAAGWHFSFKDTVGREWRSDILSTQSGWLVENATDDGISTDGWRLITTSPGATVTAPAQRIDTLQAPFIQVRWKAEGYGAGSCPFIEWATTEHPAFSRDRRMDVSPPPGGVFDHAVIPVYRHPLWRGQISQLRFGLGNLAAGSTVTLRAVFTQYDTRQNVNSQSFIDGCATYFWWTGDTAFLRRNIGRMRLAMRHVLDEHHALAENLVRTDWVGHDGRSGLAIGPGGKKAILHGHGIGNNYWDLLPFGWKDCYATVRHYAAVRALAEIEREIDDHPEWGVASDTLRIAPADLERHAAAVRETGNRVFWNNETGRFVACEDADGKTHDYGLTFLNLEAVHYGFATPEHARAIVDWVSGRRILADDTSTGTDIYHWRFGPRATTRRNVDWYFWGWTGPETIPWGGQVQDGGGVLAFSYHDLMARLQTAGPADAAARLGEVAEWFGEVQAAGGYRKYYDGRREGKLQGGGTAGGLGFDHEFYESVMVPQVMLDGFLGFQARGDGFRVAPAIPPDWPKLEISFIRWHGLDLAVRVTSATVEIRPVAGAADSPVAVEMPGPRWFAAVVRADGATSSVATRRRPRDNADVVDWTANSMLRFQREHTDGAANSNGE